MRLKTLGKSPVPMKFTDHAPNTGFYGPHVDQSECRILQSRIIIVYPYYHIILKLLPEESVNNIYCILDLSKHQSNQSVHGDRNDGNLAELRKSL